MNKAAELFTPINEQYLNTIQDNCYRKRKAFKKPTPTEECVTTHAFQVFKLKFNQTYIVFFLLSSINYSH